MIHLHGKQFYPRGYWKGCVIISMRVGDHKVKGVLHEVLHVLGLVGYIHDWGTKKE
jgi:hypothetical protein